MQLSSIPRRIAVAFGQYADPAYIREIPDASQVAVTPGAASLADGFPAANFKQPNEGGVPLSGRDVNGILKLSTSWNRWHAAGGPIYYEPAFAAAIGGYPKQAKLASLTSPEIIWQSTVDGNLTDPDSAQAANWVNIFGAFATKGYTSTKFADMLASFTALTATVSKIRQGQSAFGVYDAPGTYPLKVPDDIYIIKYNVAGAGAGGAGAGSQNSGGGGGAGGYVWGYAPVTPGQVIPITVGAPGLGGTNGGAGGNGGMSSFGAYATATGGGGAAPGNSDNPAGGGFGQGFGSNGMLILGGYGTDGCKGGSFLFAGNGGASWCGGGGRGGAGFGLSAVARGAGGGGGNLANSPGGDGGLGIVTIEY